MIADRNRSLQLHTVVLSCKGGVGKTTTAVGLGSALALLRGERVVAVDANHFGTLAGRVHDASGASLSELAADADAGRIPDFSSLRGYLGHNGGGLHTVGHGRSPSTGASEYEAVAGLIEHHADAVLTDCGTDLDRDPVIAAAVARAGRAVVVADPTEDALSAAEKTLAWLGEAHAALARTALIALCQRASRTQRTRAAAQRLGAHGGTVVIVPFDRHLQKNGVVDQRRLRRATRSAYTRLAELISPGTAAS
ncbi:AAA family ATPase [Nocardiopsis sp. CNT-189]|uniref:MinD/ParA family ATP-binding protein n=1 Tax=Nocardiopsis oceanisediminis TaxID=2816862 RepID=UPI003B2E4131